MSFRFRVLHVWEFEGRPDISAIGTLEEGKIIPPTRAFVAGSDVAVRIDSIALGGGRSITGHSNELTLILKCSEIAPKSLEGSVLISN